MSKKPPPQPIFTFRSTNKSVYCIYFKTDDPGNYAYCGVDGAVQKWDVKVYRMVGQIETGSAAVVQVGESSKYFVTQERGGRICGWSSNTPLAVPLTSWTVAWSFNTECVTLCRISFSISDIWCPKANNTLCRYLEGQPTSSTWTPAAKEGLLMALSPLDEGGVLVACESGLVTAISTGGDTVSCHLQLSAGDIPTAMDCVNSTVIIGSTSTTLFRLTVSLGEVKVSGTTELSTSGVGAVALRSDCALVAVATWMKSIKVLSVKNLRLLAILAQPANVGALVWTNCDGLLYCGDDEGRISMYSLYPPPKNTSKDSPTSSLKKVQVEPISHGGQSQDANAKNEESSLEHEEIDADKDSTAKPNSTVSEESKDSYEIER